MMRMMTRMMMMILMTMIMMILMILMMTMSVCTHHPAGGLRVKSIAPSGVEAEAEKKNSELPLNMNIYLVYLLLLRITMCNIFCKFEDPHLGSPVAAQALTSPIAR